MERLINVQRFRPDNRAVSMQNLCPVGTQFCVVSSAGELVLTPVANKSFCGIMDDAFEGFLKYLTSFWDTAHMATLSSLAKRILRNGVTPKESNTEFQKLLYTSELIIRAWEDGRSAVRALLPTHKPFTTQQERRREWSRVYSDIKGSRSIIRTNRYGRARVNHVVIPSALSDAAAFRKREPVSLIERDDGTYLIRRATKEERKYMMNVVPIIRPGTVHGGRYLYLTQTQKDALRIGPELYREGVNLKVTFDFTGKKSITLERVSKEELEALPRTPCSPKPEWYDSVQTVKVRISGAVILPMEFTRRFEVEKNDTLHTELSDKKLVIYGRDSSCDICGHSITKEQRHIVPVCPSCADIIPEVRKSVHASPAGISGAIADTKAELTAALAKLAAYEGGTK